MTEERKLLREAREYLWKMWDGSQWGKLHKLVEDIDTLLSAPAPEPVALKEKGRARNGAEWQEPSELVSTRNELQSIRSAEMPVEPDFISIMRGITRNGGGDSIRYIDALKAYALKLKHNGSVTMDELGDMRDRAEKAESELAALRGRLMEPDEEMRKFARTLLSMSTVKTEADAVMLFKAMSAVALKN